MHELVLFLKRLNKDIIVESEKLKILNIGLISIGGLLILLGLFTQLVSIPLAFVMLVALLTAHLAEVNSLMDLFAQTPFIYMVIFLVLSSTGAGKWSVDSKRDN